MSAIRCRYPNNTRSQHCMPTVGKNARIRDHLMDTDYDNSSCDAQGHFYNQSLPFVVYLGRVRDWARNHHHIGRLGGSEIRSRFRPLWPPSVLPAFINLLVTRTHKIFDPAAGSNGEAVLETDRPCSRWILQWDTGRHDLWTVGTSHELHGAWRKVRERRDRG